LCAAHTRPRPRRAAASQPTHSPTLQVFVPLRIAFSASVGFEAMNEWGWCRRPRRRSHYSLGAVQPRYYRVDK